jgi:hypothetical protein
MAIVADTEKVSLEVGASVGISLGVKVGLSLGVGIGIGVGIRVGLDVGNPLGVGIGIDVGFGDTVSDGVKTTTFPVTTRANFWLSSPARPLSVVTTTAILSPTESVLEAIVVFSTLF